MSSLMTCAAVFALVSRSSEGKPNAPKKRVDSARSLTGRLTAILVAIGRSLSIGEDARSRVPARRGGQVDQNDVVHLRSLLPRDQIAARGGRVSQAVQMPGTATLVNT